MTDIARLAIAVDTSQVTAAENALQKLTQTGAQTVSSVNAIGAAHARSGQAIQRTGQMTTQQLQGMQFQLQDLAVQLASGSSPFIAITQQGSQIAQAFAAGTGPMAALRAFGAGIVSFLTNPLNIAVVAIAAASAALSAFVGWLTGGANAALESHNRLLDILKANYGDLAKQVQALGRESKAVVQTLAQADLDRQTKALQAQSAATREQIANIRSLVQVRQAMSFGLMERGATPFLDIMKQFSQGTMTAEQFKNQVAAIEQQFRSPAVTAYAAGLFDVANSMIEVENRARQAGMTVAGLANDLARAAYMSKEFDRAAAEIKSLTPDLRTPQQRVADALKVQLQNAQSPEQAIAAEREAQNALNQLQIQKEQADALKAASAAASAAKSAASEAKRNAEAVAQTLADLERQQGLVGAGPTAVAISNAVAQAQQQGASLEAQRTIANTMAATAAQTQALEESQNRYNEALQTSRDVTSAWLSSLVNGLAQGKGVMDSLSDSVKSFGMALLNVAQNQALNALFGGGEFAGGGLFASLFGPSPTALASIAGKSGGFYAAGGRIPSGQWGIVGEKGPEAVYGPATVIPNGGGAQRVEVSVAVRPSRELWEDIDQRTVRTVQGYDMTQARATMQRQMYETRRRSADW